MQPIVKTRLAELRTLCRQHHVRRLDLFGSAAHGDFDPERSDVDFVVEFAKGAPGPSTGSGALDAYFGFKEALEALLGRPVDLVMAGAIENPYLRASIERSRETVYAG
jgi:uncharacterized protein